MTDLRFLRKQLVFHIMYGHFPDAMEEEMQEWRRVCGEYIDGNADKLPPLALSTFHARYGYPCRVCAYAVTCGDPPGEDCHS